MSGQEPDVTEAVANAIRVIDANYTAGGTRIEPAQASRLAKAAIAAHDEELKRQGFVVVKIGEVPPWMEKRRNPCFDFDTDEWTDGDCYAIRAEGIDI